MGNIPPITLLAKEQVWGKDALGIFDTMGAKMNDKLPISEMEKTGLTLNRGRVAELTPFARCLGAFADTPEGEGHWATGTQGPMKPDYDWSGDLTEKRKAVCVGTTGYGFNADFSCRSLGGRPAIKVSELVKRSPNGVWSEKNGIPVFTAGEYPQSIVSEKLAQHLENLYNNMRMAKTGKAYLTDSREITEYKKNFVAMEHNEYSWRGEKYVRCPMFGSRLGVMMTDGKLYGHSEPVWCRVENIDWLVDKEKDMAVSEKLLFSGVRQSDMDKFLHYFSQNIDLEHAKVRAMPKLSKPIVARQNGYTLTPRFGN